MHSITTTLKHNILNSNDRSYPQPHPTQNSSSPTNTHTHSNHHAEHKYMQHFETINKVTHHNVPQSIDSHSDRFKQTLIDYSSKNSCIDSILISSEVSVPLGELTQKLAKAPIVPNLKESSDQEIRNIHQIFEGLEMKENREDNGNQLPVVEVFSEMLRDIGRKNKALENKILAKSKVIVKNPTYHELSVKEIPTQTRQFESFPQQSEEKQKTRRKDLILMEILSEKKRKNFAADYFETMELKLMELLDFILQDEEEYYGMDPQVKVKTVLRNLERFQGRMIEGESKINLLRIFFEEFTSLKREKDEREMMKTPMRKVENKQRGNSGSNKFRETKQTAALTVTPQRKTVKAKKQPQFAWIQGSYNLPLKKPTTQPKDEWIGSL